MDANKKQTEGTERLPEPTQPQTEAQGASAARAKWDGRTFLLNVFFGLLYALWGYLLGGAVLPFGTRPFGIALLCAADRRVIYLWAGLCVAAWRSEDRLLWLGVLTAVLLIRLLVRFALDTPWSEEESASAGERTFGEVWPVLFSEHVSLRMATAAIAAFAVGIYRLSRGGFLYYDLYGTILGVVAAPAAVLLFSGFFSDESAGVWRKRSGLLSLAFVLLWATGDATLYGVSLGVFGCMFLVLYLTRKQGIVAGVIAGTVCGLAISVELAPLFAFGALSAGLLLAVSPFLACSAACSVSVAWGFYVRGIGALNGLAPAILGACVLFAVMDKLFFSASRTETAAETTASAERTERKACVPLGREAMDHLRLTDTHRRIKELCEGFSSLSEVFYGLSRRMQTPTEGDLRQICDHAFDSSCATCPDRTGCWGERYHLSAGEVGTLSAILHRNGHLTAADAPKSLTARCGRLPDILEEINHHAALHAKELLQGDRTEVFAQDYEAVSEILATAMVDEAGEYEIDETRSLRLCDELRDESLGIRGVCVSGGRKRRVTLWGTDCRDFWREKDRLRQMAEEACAFPLNGGTVFEEDAALVFEEAETLSVCCAKRTLCAEGEDSYCGDTVSVFRKPDGRFYALISDGMGSGREAALTSGVSGLFLRRMIGAGIPCETALKLLNGFLRNRGSGSVHECSATVDLMEMDLMKSRASFYKSGAAPTYVFRSGSLFKLRSHTVPVGIIREMDTRRIRFDVNEGDVVVMISDGVTGGKEECPWLFDLLRSQAQTASADRLADLIVKYAKGEGCRDDLSVLIVKIEGAKTAVSSEK